MSHRLALTISLLLTLVFVGLLVVGQDRLFGATVPPETTATTDAAAPGFAGSDLAPAANSAVVDASLPIQPFADSPSGAFVVDPAVAVVGGDASPAFASSDHVGDHHDHGHDNHDGFVSGSEDD